MNVILEKASGALRKPFYLAVEKVLIVVQWKLKFLKVQLKKWKRCGAQKELDKAYTKLGAEVFALYKGGQTDLQGVPLVEQKMKLVEEAENGLFAVDEEVDAINTQYQEKKEAISSKYRMKRSGEGESGQE